MTFEEAGVPRQLCDELARRGITEPTPIQAAAIPPAMEGRDVCGKAKTGSGKTLAFGIPLMLTISPGAPKKPAAVVLVPTRELAVQVAEALEPLAAVGGRSVTTVYGGVPIKSQITKVAAGVDIVVATPGRLIDLVEQKAADLSAVTDVVIDEADRMADMGFQPQVEWLLRHMTGRGRTMLFSATLDHDVNVLITRYLRDPVLVDVTEPQPTMENMDHLFLTVHEADRDKVVASIVRNNDRTIVFCATKRACDRVALHLRDLDVNARAIHGDLRQSDREKALERFSEGQLSALIATDVAARGIHVDDVDVVIHLDPTEDHKAYLHRSGRTARAGASGVVVTLVLWNQELEVRRLKRRLKLDDLPIVEVFSNDPRLADVGAFARELAAKV
jgi:superfamily II DNA/RNA helicase